MKLIVKSFQRSCHVQLDLDILFIKLTAQIGYCICKITSAHCVSGVGNFMQWWFLFVISCKVPQLWSSLDFPSCKSESWRRCTCTNVLLVCEGGIGPVISVLEV